MYGDTRKIMPKIVILIPYCPLPIDSGAKAEMWKHLGLLREIGDCTILSASSRPVGTPWSNKNLAEVRNSGFKVILRENGILQRLQSIPGLLYGAICTALGWNRAFGHANPYHRCAFPLKWWQKNTKDADLVVINYSHWASLPVNGPKAIILHDLWSDVMWGGASTETHDLSTCDLVLVISSDEREKLMDRGLSNIVCSPPVSESTDFELTDSVGIVGSNNELNREGILWLMGGNGSIPEHSVRVYGKLAELIPTSESRFEVIGKYEDSSQPYRDCGIIMIPTASGSGVQIKAIEALSAGCAIVARRGAMRGIPSSSNAWIEVETPGDMWREAMGLRRDSARRQHQGKMAKLYYKQHLDAHVIKEKTRKAYADLLEVR